MVPTYREIGHHVQSRVLYMDTVHAANRAYIVFYKGERLLACGGTEDNIQVWFEHETNKKKKSQSKQTHVTGDSSTQAAVS